MKITVIHGQNHEGSTCQAARLVARKIGGEIREFFLPRDFGEFCVGCTTCFMKDERKCPHYEKLRPLTEAIDEADVIILASPVYVYHVTGAMKAFLDHYGYRWLVHRPEEKMFSKQAVCVSTAAGAGMKSAVKDMADSAFYWGCARIYPFGVAVRAVSWKEIPSARMAKLEKKADAIAKKIVRGCGKVKPGLRTKFMFGIMRLMQKNGGWNEADHSYWKEKGWLGKARPWN